MATGSSCLQQASGKLDSPLGGFSVILFGDFGQLTPVGDRPLYAEPSFNELSIYGHHIYQIFTTVVILDHVLRQGGTDPVALRFQKLLLRLRAGTVTHDDWQMLLAHSPNKVTNCADFVDALRLFYDKESVAQYNMRKLESLGEPIAWINAIHSNAAAASTKADDPGGLSTSSTIPGRWCMCYADCQPVAGGWPRQWSSRNCSPNSIL